MKNKSQATLILLTIVLLLLSMFLTAGIYRMDQKISRFKSVIDEKNSLISHYINENGRVVADKKAAEVRASEIKSMYPEIYASVKKDFDIKIKDLKAYMQSEFKATGSGKSDVHNHYYPATGSVATDIVSRDGYLDYKGTIIDSVRATYEYSYTDTIKYAISVRRDWLFGNEKLYSSATLSNKNAKIYGSRSILIDDYRDKRWGLGVGLFYDGRVRLGVGVQYNLLKF